MNNTTELLQDAANTVQKETWRIRLYRDEDKPSLLRLSALHYGDKELAREEYVNWLRGGTPAGPTVTVVAEDIASSEIVGFSWNLPFRVSFQGRSELCYLGCNQLIHPDYRKRGLFRAMHDIVFKSLEESLFKYGFPKPMAVGPLRKVGFFLIGRSIPLLVRPLDIARLTQASIENRVVRLVINACWTIAGATIWRPCQSNRQNWGIRVFEEPSFDESFDEFWKRVVHKYDIIISRDRAFLNWRFCKSSFRSYVILVARAGNGVVGYVVLRCVDMEGVRTGLVIDFLVEPTTRGEQSGLLLLEEATRRFQEAGIVVAGGLMFPHTQEYALLRRAGYLKCPGRFAPQPFCLAVTPLSPRAPQELLMQADRWFMTMANHDAV